MALLHEKVSNTSDAALDSRRGDLSSWFHFQAREDLRSAILSAILEVNFLYASSAASPHVNDYVHLVSGRMGHGLCGNLARVEALLVQCVAQALDAFVNDLLTIGLPERDLHRRRCRRLRRRRRETQDDHLIEEELFSSDEIDP